MATRPKMGFEQLRKPQARRGFPPPTAEELEWKRRYWSRFQYRLMIFDRPAAPWRDTLGQAQLDAVLAGLGSVEQYSGRFYLTVPASILEREKPQP